MRTVHRPGFRPPLRHLLFERAQSITIALVVIISIILAITTFAVPLYQFLFDNFTAFTGVTRP